MRPTQHPVRTRGVTIEDNPEKLGLLLEQLDSNWGLFLRLPEIPDVEFGHASLNDLRSAFVDVSVWHEPAKRVSALELRPGVGCARVFVSPSSQPYRCNTTGDWPSSITVDRWRNEIPGVSAGGTLFRIRNGEWVRLRAKSGVHWGDRMLVLAAANTPPPRTTITEVADHFSHAGKQWKIWHVQLPEEGATEVKNWLSNLGHSVVPSAWSISLAMPARRYTESGYPVFWLGDDVVLELEAPSHNTNSMAFLNTETSEYSIGIPVGSSRRKYLSLTSFRPGIAKLSVTGDRDSSLEVKFETQPSFDSALEALANTPRLRIYLDENCVEAWRDTKRAIYVSPHALPAVKLEVGAEGVRIHIRVCVHGKRLLYRELSEQDAQSIIISSLSVASRIEIDAENLGRIELKVISVIGDIKTKRSQERLAEWERLQCLASRESEWVVPAFIAHLDNARALRVQSVGAAALVRERLAARRRQKLRRQMQ